MQSIRAAVVAGAAFLSVLAPRLARAAADLHWIGEDVRITVTPSAVGSIDHSAAFHVERGPLQKILVDGVGQEVAVDAAATILSANGTTIPAVMTFDENHVLRAEVGDKRGLAKGDYTLHFRAGVDFASIGALSRESTGWKLTWLAPAAPDAYENARVVFNVPSAPSPPERVDEGTAAVIEEVHRGGVRDEIQLTRMHVSKGERVVWSLHLDPKIFPAILGPPATVAKVEGPPRQDAMGRGGWDVCVAALFAALIFIRSRLLHGPKRGDLGVGKVDRRIVSIAGGIIFGASTFALAEGLSRSLILIAASTAIAIALSFERAPNPKTAMRGPGRWLALRAEEAFARPPEKSVPKVASVLFRCAVLLLAAAVFAIDPTRSILSALPFIPLLLLQRDTESMAMGSRSADKMRRVYEHLTASGDIRAVPWGRVPDGETTFDELRVLAVPRTSVKGLIGFEVGVAWRHLLHGLSPYVEVLVRVHTGSEASDLLTRRVIGARVVPGRSPHESVVSVVPPIPTIASVCALVRSLAEIFERDDVAISLRSRPSVASIERRQNRATRSQPDFSLADCPP